MAKVIQAGIRTVTAKNQILSGTTFAGIMTASVDIHKQQTLLSLQICSQNSDPISC